MIYSEQIKPLSYVKSHSSELINQINKSNEPVIITINGEAKAVLQSIYSFEKEEKNNRDFNELMKLRMNQYKNGKGTSLDKSLKSLDIKISELSKLERA